MFPQQLDLRDRDSIYAGLSVKLITDEGEEVGGIVKKILTLTKFDFKGVYVELKTGQRGHVTEVIESESERDVRRLIAKFYSDTASDIDEGDYLEFKETFAFNASRSDNEPDKTLMKVAGKTVQAFANSKGGTLYIGIQDRTKVKMGLERDYSVLKRNKDADGLEIAIRDKLEKFFQRGQEIFSSVFVKIIKIEGKDVCIINVLPSKIPFILTSEGKEYFHRRIGNESVPCTANEFYDYWQERLEESKLL